MRFSPSPPFPQWNSSIWISRHSSHANTFCYSFLSGLRLTEPLSAVPISLPARPPSPASPSPSHFRIAAHSLLTGHAPFDPLPPTTAPPTDALLSQPRLPRALRPEFEPRNAGHDLGPAHFVGCHAPFSSHAHAHGGGE